MGTFWGLLDTLSWHVQASLLFLSPVAFLKTGSIFFSRVWQSEDNLYFFLCSYLVSRNQAVFPLPASNDLLGAGNTLPPALHNLMGWILTIFCHCCPGSLVLYEAGNNTTTKYEAFPSPSFYFPVLMSFFSSSFPPPAWQKGCLLSS